MSLSKLGLMLAGFYMLTLLSLLPAASALQWQDVAGELMSPACPGRTLINCTSGQSEQLRELIRQKVDQGESKAAIMKYFVDMHGEEILAAPPQKGLRPGGLALAALRAVERRRFDYGVGGALDPQPRPPGVRRGGAG